MNLCRLQALQVRGDEIRTIEDTIVKEETFQLHINDTPFTTIVASGDQLAELGAGFVICEGISPHVDTVEVNGRDIYVTAEVPGHTEKELGTSGGTTIRRVPKTVRSHLTIEPHAIFDITREIVTDLWRQTGGVHCAVLFSEDHLIAKSNDVGRHNAIDKVVGYAALNEIDRARCVVGCTGRQPKGMVSKIANAGIPIIVSKAASTDQGIRVAEETGVTLICFARDERFTVYTHPHRVRGLGNSGIR
jgi:FdhD protein